MPNGMSTPPPPETPLTWDLADLLDFDFATEEAAKARSLKSHRQTYLRYLSSQGLDAQTAPPDSRHDVFRHWLETQRQAAPAGTVWPGKLFNQARKVVSFLILVIAVVSGSLITASLLHYDGSQPINVSRFLFLLLGGQLLLLLSGATAFGLRRMGWLKPESGFIGPAIQTALNQALQWLQKHGVQPCSAETRLQLHAFYGSLTQKQSHFQPLILGVISGLAQTFGIAFNIAAIVTTLFLVTVSDRAFGWQSSLDLSAERVHAMTSTIATPWSGILPAGAPTEEEIQGSRIYLKDGMRRLTNQDLVSWWPFLVCSLVVYGLLPRCLLWALCWLYVHRHIKRQRFDSLFCDRLWEAMTQKALETQTSPKSRPQAQPSPANSPAPLRNPLSVASSHSPRPRPHVSPKASPSISSPTAPAPSSHPSPSPSVASPQPSPVPIVTEEATDPSPPPPPISPEKSAYLFVDPELAKRTHRAEIDTAVQQSLGWIVQDWILLPDESESWSKFWNRLEAYQTEPAYDRIALLQEAYQPPIREALDWLTDLRESQSPKGKAMIFLIGRSPEAGQLGEACRTNQIVWERSVEALEDPNLGVTPILTQTEDG